MRPILTEKEAAAPLRSTAPDTRQLLVDHITAGQTDFYRLVFSYVQNRDAALDVVQEAVVKALTKVDTLREPAYLKTWFYRILLNECMNHFGRAGDLSPLKRPWTSARTEGRDPGERLDLYDAIGKLSPVNRR